MQISNYENDVIANEMWAKVTYFPPCQFLTNDYLCSLLFYKQDANDQGDFGSNML